MRVIANPYRLSDRQIDVPDATPFPSTDMARPMTLLARCPRYAPTPLQQVSGLADIARVDVKDERARMGLGSFKALGAAYVIRL